MILVTLLLVNMLIAMMGNTYQLINETQKEWFRQVRVVSLGGYWQSVRHTSKKMRERMNRVGDHFPWWEWDSMGQNRAYQCSQKIYLSLRIKTISETFKSKDLQQTDMVRLGELPPLLGVRWKIPHTRLSIKQKE